MRISDWSLDVCSSDLSLGSQRRQTSQARKTVGFRLGLEATPFGLCPFDIALVVVEAPEGDGNPGDQCDIVGLAHEAQAAPDGIILRCARLLEDHLGACAGDCRFSHIRSEEHTSELQSLMRISYAVFCLKKKQSQK